MIKEKFTENGRDFFEVLTEAEFIKVYGVDALKELKLVGYYTAPNFTYTYINK